VKKFLFFVFVVFLLFSFEKAYANMKAVKKSQVFSCDGVMYGYHGDSIHYHRVVKKGDTWYPDGDEVVPPCAPSSVEGSKEVVTLSSCVDGVLLQQRLVEEGFASVSYLYGDYLYTSLLQDSEEVAKVNRVGRWNEEDVLLKEKALHEEGDSSFLDSLFDKIEKWFEELFKEVRKFFKNLF